VQPPRTLQDILDILAQREQAKPNLVRMLKSTAGRISNWLGKKPCKIDASGLPAVIDFQQYLRSRRYPDSSVDTYTYLFRRICSVTGELDSRLIYETDEHWQGPLAAVSKTALRQGFGALLRWAVRKGKTPHDLTNRDVDSYCEELALKRKRGYTSAQRMKPSLTNFLHVLDARLASARYK